MCGCVYLLLDLHHGLFALAQPDDRLVEVRLRRGTLSLQALDLALQRVALLRESARDTLLAGEIAPQVADLVAQLCDLRVLDFDLPLQLRNLLTLRLELGLRATRPAVEPRVSAGADRQATVQRSSHTSQ